MAASLANIIASLPLISLSVCWLGMLCTGGARHLYTPRAPRASAASGGLRSRRFLPFRGGERVGR